MKDGHAIHGTSDVKNLGKPVSHGCVRISPENAVTLYALVAENGLENTQVVLNGVTPGGEFKSARGQADFGRGRRGARAQASRAWGDSATQQRDRLLVAPESELCKACELHPHKGVRIARTVEWGRSP